MAHELTHAFHLEHKCGNWDWRDLTERKSCAMNYGSTWILDHPERESPSERTIIPWTGRRNEDELCARHVRAIREARLEEHIWP